MRKKRVVVKIGSSSLTDDNGGLSKEKLYEHVEAIAKLKEAGYEVILISSGAVSAGYGDLGYPSRPVTIRGKQAAAAVGQGLLIQAYTEAFKKYGIVCAQLLMTRSNFQHKEQYQNAYATLSELLKRQVLPIINENDSVSIEELTFGDNDMLSALVSGLLHADFLIILTDINGLYEEDPTKNPNAKRFDFLPEVTDELIEQTEATSGSKVGTGGMKSKLMAAKTALALGVSVFIGKGQGKEKLIEILNGNGDGTYIGKNDLSAVRNSKAWIALHSIISGDVEVDDGAVAAILKEGKSLLPAGVKRVSGNFQSGDVVQILNKEQKLIGKGIVNYSSEELKEIMGMPSQKAMEMTKRIHPEVVHRDQFVAITSKEMMI
ncbi:glutamate 5-kinase [Aeribacillus sp. FSL M8-0254]|uniref:glutamate 5-kinase n=1 Tax=Aeribacillus sp. FSL M8-0254 TaxID=2954577 RepID=UPI0030F7D2A0